MCDCYYKVEPYGNGFAVRLGYNGEHGYAQRSNRTVNVFSTVERAWKSVGVYTYPDGYAHMGSVYQWDPVARKASKRATPLKLHPTPQQALKSMRAKQP